jgi:hypothetical protein
MMMEFWPLSSTAMGATPEEASGKGKEEREREREESVNFHAEPGAWERRAGKGKMEPVSCVVWYLLLSSHV